MPCDTVVLRWGDDICWTQGWNFPRVGENTTPFNDFHRWNATGTSPVEASLYWIENKKSIRTVWRSAVKQCARHGMATESLQQSKTWLGCVAQSPVTSLRSDENYQTALSYGVGKALIHQADCTTCVFGSSHNGYTRPMNSSTLALALLEGGRLRRALTWLKTSLAEEICLVSEQAPLLIWPLLWCLSSQNVVCVHQRPALTTTSGYNPAQRFTAPRHLVPARPCKSSCTLIQFPDGHIYLLGVHAVKPRLGPQPHTRQPVPRRPLVVKVQ